MALRKHSKIIYFNNNDYNLLDLLKRQIDEIERVEEQTLRKHVVVIGGGVTKKCRDYSMKDSDYLIRIIFLLGYKVTFIEMGKDVASILQRLNPDVVFPMYYGKFGEDGSLPGLLNILEIPYTRCGVLPQVLGLNKEIQYNLFNSLNILAPLSKVVKKTDKIKIDPLPRPYIIKPVENDFSFGIKAVFKDDSFKFGDYKFNFGESVIVSEFIEGRELNVAVLNGKALENILEVQLLEGKKYFDEEAKSKKLYMHKIPARITKSVERELKEKSELLWKLFKCSGLLRVEFILSKIDNKCYILEANPMAGIGEFSGAPDIAKHSGINYPELIRNLINEAFLTEMNEL